MAPGDYLLRLDARASKAIATRGVRFTVLSNSKVGRLVEEARERPETRGLRRTADPVSRSNHILKQKLAYCANVV